MRDKRKTAWLAVLVAAAFLAEGCDDSEGGKAPAGGPDLRGAWSGRYVRPGVSEPLQARVIQDGDAVVIQTTRAQAGRLLTGYLNDAARLTMTDGYDGELWTSASPASPTRLHLHDYLQSPSLGYDPPLQEIILTR